MAGSSDPNSYGFFGQGYWGRKVFWEKIPVQHRNLDTEGYLEGLLRVFGDECESFLQQIANLPLQREPYLVRAKEGEQEWFYFTEAINYSDDHWGDVVRLVGEKLYADMPNHDEDDTPTADADELEQWWGWWPYVPISSIARWWSGTWDSVSYEVVRVRTRSFDWAETPYNETSSQANEVWLRGGDLRIFFDYFSDGVTWRDNWTSIGTGDGTVSPVIDFPFLPVRLEYNSTSSAPPWLISDAKLKLRLNLTTNGEYTDLFDVPDVTTETGNLYPQTISASNSGVTISFAISGNVVTVTDTSSPFGSGMIGDTIRITGTTSNNGVFIVITYVDANNLEYVNVNGAAEAGAVGNAWEVGNGEINTTTSYGTIDYQIGKIELDLTAASDTVVSGSSIVAKWYVKGYYLSFYPPRVIDYLARDFGFLNDKNDPEDVQRSTIANITKYHGLKSSQDSYRIRGEISLFSVVATALWYMCDEDSWNSLPIEHQFMHHGNRYTDLEPRVIRFDDIVADQQFYDPDVSAWVTILDKNLMYEDSSTDGHSVGLGYALDVAQGYYGEVSPLNSNFRDPAGVISSTLLTNEEAITYGFQAGYRVIVSIMRCQYEAFNWHKGFFGLTEYDKANSIPPSVSDDVFWIDDVEVEWVKTVTGATAEEDIGVWTVIIGVGVDGSGNPNDGPVIGHSDVVGVNQGTKTFTISGDHTSTLQVSNKIAVMRSTGNDGDYTIDVVSLNGSDTDVQVLEVIPSATVDGVARFIDIAVRYWPEVVLKDCCYCKSYKMRIEIEPTDEAYEFYDTDAALNAAIGRMKNKIAPVSSASEVKPSLVPIHTRVVDWAVRKEWILENVHSGNTVYEELTGEFLSDPISSISAVDQANDIFTIRGDQRNLLASGDKIDIRDSTGNDGGYTITSLLINSNGTDTDVGVASIPSAVADGSLYLRPAKILLTVDQRGDMSAGQTQAMTVYDETPSSQWTSTTTTNVSDATTWYNVVTNYDMTDKIGNNSPVKIEAVGGVTMTYGDVRFTFEISKYSR